MSKIKQKVGVSGVNGVQVLDFNEQEVLYRMSLIFAHIERIQSIETHNRLELNIQVFVITLLNADKSRYAMIDYS